MGCCESKEKQVSSSATEKQKKENPERSSLRHPQAQGQSNRKDEEQGGKWCIK